MQPDPSAFGNLTLFALAGAFSNPEKVLAAYFGSPTIGLSILNSELRNLDTDDICFLLIAASIMASRKLTLYDGGELCLHRNANSGGGSKAEKRGASAGLAISTKDGNSNARLYSGTTRRALDAGGLKI